MYAVYIFWCNELRNSRDLLTINFANISVDILYTVLYYIFTECSTN